MGEAEAGRAAFEGYAVLELMGHRRLGGYVRETTLAGAAVFRIDIPKKDADCWKTTDAPTKPETAATQFYGGAALFALTPCRAAMARAVALHAQPIELTYYEQQELPRALPAGDEETITDAEFEDGTPSDELP